jgi:subtilisin family serine protease
VNLAKTMTWPVAKATPQLGIVAVVLSVFGCETEAVPLPGYVPDPDVFAAPPNEATVTGVPAHPGLQAPVDRMVLLLVEGEGPDAAARIAEVVGGQIVGQVPALGYFQLGLATTTMAALDEAIATATADPATAAAGYDFVVQFRECPASSDVGNLEPSASCPWTDSNYPALLDVFEERGGDIPGGTVTVAVIDSGIDVSNGELDDVLIGNVHAVGGATSGMRDPRGHGTKVAGVIAADDGDGGVNGVASRILGPKLRLLWGLHPSGGSTLLAVASQSIVATQLAIDAGATVVNFSFGFGPFATSSPATQQAAVRSGYQRLMRRNPNVLFVAAVANQSWELTAQNDAPAGITLPNVISVGSSMPCDPRTRVGPSARGPLVDIVAQGERMTLVNPASGRPVVLEDGTSFSTPQVAAAAAILRSIDPSLTAPGVRDYLLGYPSLGPETTAGRYLDVATPALQLLLDQGNALASDIDPDEDGVADDAGLVAARVCGGSSLTVDGLPSQGFSATSRPEDEVLSMGFFGADGFGIVLQKPGFITFSLACDGCPWDLASFPIADNAADGAAGAFTIGTGVGGDTVSGTWDFVNCVIQSRYPSILAADGVPETVRVESTATGVMEVSTGSTDNDPRGFQALIDAPFTVEPLSRDDPLIMAIESACENGRLR